MANISLDQKDTLYWNPAPCIIDLPAEEVYSLSDDDTDAYHTQAPDIENSEYCPNKNYSKTEQNPAEQSTISLLGCLRNQ